MDQPDAFADQPVHVRLSGLPSGKPVTVGADAADRNGKKWHGEVTLTADKHGAVDLDTAKPSSGSYRNPDGMGLFWSMNPPEGDPDLQALVPPLESGKPVEHVELSVSRAGKRLASTTVTRRWIADGMTATPLTLAKDKLLGTYLAPRPDGAKHPAVLWFGGSEGGTPAASTADLLVAHGYPVLMLAYFRAPGLPAEIRNIPIEYFAAAATWLRRQPAVDPARTVTMTASYGTEAALHLAELRPDLMRGTVLFAPSATDTGSFPTPGGAAWTYGGRPLPQGPIPVDHVRSAVLAIAGGDDLVWGSRLAANRIVYLLDAADPAPHKAIVVDGAGHAIAAAPYLPRGTKGTHPITRMPESYGGSREANDAAMRQGWGQVLALLQSV